MKNIGLFVIALAVSLSIGGKAFADTNIATLADKAGITPDNTILYPIDKAIDNLRINFASSDDKKAEVLADVAEERLGESEVMNNRGKTDLANQTMKDYSDKITEAQDKVENAIDEETNSTENSAVKLDKLKTLETTIENKQEYSIGVLKNIESKVSGNAKETIAQVIEMQTRKKDVIAAVIKERQTLLQDKKAVKEAEKALDQAKKTGDNQVIKIAEDTLAQAQLTLSTQNTKFDQVVQSKKEAKDDQSNDASSSINDTTTDNTKTSTEVSSEQNDDTISTTTAATNSETNTSQGTVTSNTTTTNDTNIDITAKENKGQEMKAVKDTKTKENSSLNDDKSKN